MARLPFIGILNRNAGPTLARAISKTETTHTRSEPTAATTASSFWEVDMKLISRDIVSQDSIKVVLQLQHKDREVKLHIQTGQHIKLSAVVNNQRVTR